jgi:CheY-like chemotaxis protein
MLTPDELGPMVQDVLNHLYDCGYLQRHPLAEYVQPGNRWTPRERMRALRTLMLEMIEELSPGADVPFRSGRARAYSVLNLHYVEGMTVQEAAKELAISERQLYRDLRRAEQTIAEMIDALLLQELDRLAVGAEEAGIAALIDGAISALRPLCQQREVEVEATDEVGAQAIYTNPLLARQVLVSILSWAVQNARPGTVVRLTTHGVNGAAQFEVRFSPVTDAARVAEVPAAARGLAQHLGAEVRVDERASGEVRCTVVLGGVCETTVLVVDDNAGMLELFQRYLADHAYRLIGAQNGPEGLRLAEEQRPDVIILDVMMPRQDGWEVLQLLQNRSTTRDIPVIVCSVLDDPELAFSLGAAEFLPKPVTRSRLLGALTRCVEHSRAPSDRAGRADT